MTVALRVWPDGNDADSSKGGTASARGGRARPARSLPSTVMSSEPAVPVAMSTIGVRRRQRQVSRRVTVTATTGMMTGPPTSVKAVTPSLSAGVRCDTAASRTGWSRAASPSPSLTDS